MERIRWGYFGGLSSLVATAFLFSFQSGETSSPISLDPAAVSGRSRHLPPRRDRLQGESLVCDLNHNFAVCYGLFGSAIFENERYPRGPCLRKSLDSQAAAVDRRAFEPSRLFAGFARLLDSVIEVG